MGDDGDGVDGVDGHWSMDGVDGHWGVGDDGVSGLLHLNWVGVDLDVGGVLRLGAWLVGVNAARRDEIKLTTSSVVRFMEGIT